MKKNRDIDVVVDEGLETLGNGWHTTRHIFA